MKPGEQLNNFPIMLVQTKSDNLRGGHIYYTLTASVAGLAPPGVSVIGVPISIDIQTNP